MNDGGPARPAGLLARTVGAALVAALIVHVLEAGCVAQVQNAWFNALPSRRQAGYLSAIVGAALASALVAAALAFGVATIARRPRLSVPLAAGLPGLLVGGLVLGFANDARGPVAIRFGAAALVLAAASCIVAALHARSVAAAFRSARPVAGTASLLVSAAALVAALLFSRDGGAPAALAAEPPAKPSAASRPPDRAVAVPTAKNVLVVLCDTLRADHLGCYGYGRDTSPVLDRFAASGAWFKNAATPRPKTSPAVASLFTGTWPETHGVEATQYKLPDSALTLAEVFAGADFRTYAVTANVNISPVFGFEQGFGGFVALKLLGKEKNGADKAVDAMLAWLQQNHEQKFFAYLHLIDPHCPYRPPAEFRTLFDGDPLDRRLGACDLPITSGEPLDAIPREVFTRGSGTDLDAYVKQYDGEIRFMDREFGRLLQGLDSLGVADDTLVVFLADHGEALVDHHVYFHHGMFAYEEQVHIPLIVRGPGIDAGIRRTEQVSLVDVMPTLLEVASVAVPDSVDGRSFARLLAPSPPDAPPGEGEPTFISAKRSRGLDRGVRTNRWKAVFRSGLSGDEPFALGALLLPHRRAGAGLADLYDSDLAVELYDLVADPAEADNLALKDAERAAHLDLLSREHLSRLRSPATSMPRLDLPDDVRDELRQLGYLGR